MTIQQLQKFMSERPLLTAHGLARESGISPRLMDYIIKGERTLTDRTTDKLYPVLKKYGYTD